MPKAEMTNKDIKDLDCGEAVLEAIAVSIASHNRALHTKDDFSGTFSDKENVHLIYNQVRKACSCGVPMVSTESPVIDGLTHSIHEEQAANDIYEIRAKQAEALGHPHVAALYRHIAGEERGHKQRFAIMREEVKKEKT